MAPVESTDIVHRRDELGRWLQTREQPVLLIDAGGVLFGNVIEGTRFIDRVARAAGVDPVALLAEYCARDLDFETDRVHVHDVLEESVRRSGGRSYDDRLRARVDRWYVASTSPNPAMFSALRAMRGRGKTLVLANNEAAHWDRLKDAKFEHLELFDVIASSWRVGADKPSARYFARLDRLLHPHARVDWHLLDDNPTVIARARDEGITATLYAAGIADTAAGRST